MQPIFIFVWNFVICLKTGHFKQLFRCLKKIFICQLCLYIIATVPRFQYTLLVRNSYSFPRCAVQNVYKPQFLFPYRLNAPHSR